MKDKIKNYKIFDRKIKKNNKKSRAEEPNWNHYYYHWKNQNHKFDLKNKIERNKNFVKRGKG
jgi:hypothetical protein